MNAWFGLCDSGAKARFVLIIFLFLDAKTVESCAMSLWHADTAKAQRAIQMSLVEIERLEAIFSLSRGDSELSRLNRDSRLADPCSQVLWSYPTARGQNQG